jgi:hypothetical protein
VKRTIMALASFGAVLSLAVAVPANAATSIHFCTYEIPNSPTESKTVDVVTSDFPKPSQHKVGACKNLPIGRDFYNETGRVAQLFETRDCFGAVRYQLPDGSAVLGTSGLQSVKVLAT